MGGDVLFDCDLRRRPKPSPRTTASEPQPPLARIILPTAANRQPAECGLPDALRPKTVAAPRFISGLREGFALWTLLLIGGRSLPSGPAGEIDVPHRDQRRPGRVCD